MGHRYYGDLRCVTCAFVVYWERKVSIRANVGGLFRMRLASLAVLLVAAVLGRTVVVACEQLHVSCDRNERGSD